MIKNKKLQWALFILMAIAQLSIPIWMILSKENTKTGGKVYKFELEALDPYDPFRGKYIILNPKQNFFHINTNEETKKKHMHATFVEDSLGFAIINNLHTEMPTHSDYLTIETLSLIHI